MLPPNGIPIHPQYTHDVNRLRVFWTFVLLQLLLLTALRIAPASAVTRSPLTRPIRTAAPVDLPDVDFTDVHGDAVHLRGLRGKVVLLTFSNVRCVEESACVRPLPAYAAVAAALGERASEVAFVFVGVDERIDRPVLSEYLGAADAVAVRGWIASASNLKTLTLRMGVHMNEVDGVLLAHAPFVYLLDEHGRLRVYVPKAAPVDELIAEVRRLLP